MSQTTTMNGVDVHALMETVNAIQQDPTLAKFQFRAHNHWLTGGHNRSKIQDFYGCNKEDETRTQPFVLDNGEPPILLGQDQGPNPVEYILHALAGCLTTTMAYHAAARGIQIEAIESELEGDLDLQGFLGLSNKVPRGYQKIKVLMRVKSDAPAETLEALSKYSPVFNTVINPVPVEVQVVKQ